MTQYKLDETGFVILGHDARPYWCRMWDNEAWLFYWHSENRWVSLKQVRQDFINKAEKHAIPEAQANIYHKTHTQNTPKNIANKLTVPATKLERDGKNWL